MSTAWMDRVVILREPWRAFVMRAWRRTFIPLVGLLVAGVPGTSWDGWIDAQWLRIVVWVVAGLGLLLWVLAFVNLARNRRVLLVMMPTGSIERPRALQEVWLRRPQEYAVGATVTVTEGLRAVTGSPADPRVDLAGEGTISRVPLHGRETAAWVTEANKAMKGRGPKLVFKKAGA